MTLSNGLRNALIDYLARPGQQKLARLAQRLLHVPDLSWPMLRVELDRESEQLARHEPDQHRRRRALAICREATDLLKIELAVQRGVRPRPLWESVRIGQGVIDAWGYSDASVSPRGVGVGLILSSDQYTLRASFNLDHALAPDRAELLAATSLLESALALGVRRLELSTDAKNVLAQARAFQRGEVSGLPQLGRFEVISIQWVPRLFNRAADGLAYAATRSMPESRKPSQTSPLYHGIMGLSHDDPGDGDATNQ